MGSIDNSCRSSPPDMGIGCVGIVMYVLYWNSSNTSVLKFV